MSIQDYHLTQPCPSEEKQTKTQHKSHSIWSLHKPLNQPQEDRNQKEERIQPSSLGREERKHSMLKKKNKRQRNTAQMKEQTRNTEVQINEEEIGKLPEKEFRIMIVKMTKNLENKMENTQESINKDLEELKNKHTETNKTITEVKNTLKGINRISEAEEWISELEDKMVKITSEE